jgi:hypothetical protein
VLAEQGTLA